MEENKFSLKSCLANLDLMIAGTVLAILIVLTFAGVIWRYFLGKPFTWLEEVQTACMVWIVFSAAGAALAGRGTDGLHGLDCFFCGRSSFPHG